jgi:hypothetical protein
MKFAYILLTAVLLSLAIFNGCKKDDNPVTAGTGGVIMPLKVGNFWFYEEISLDTAGIIIGADTVGFMVMRDTTIGGEKWYFIGVDSTAREMLANRTDGLWYARLRSGSDSGSPAFLYAKYPATVNYTWPLPDTTTKKVVSVDTSLALSTIPDTTFRCYLYGTIANGSAVPSLFSFFPPGIGFVREEVYDQTPSGRPYLRNRRDILGARFYKASFGKVNAANRGLFFHLLRFMMGK